MEPVRRAAVAGRWYPGDADRLAQAVDAHLSAATIEPGDRRPRAIIAPHAGLAYSGPVAAYAYRALPSGYGSAVLVGPSHFVPFSGIASWPGGAWDTPFGPVPIDRELAAAVAAASPAIVENTAAHAREHSIEMQLPFLLRLLPAVRIVPLVMGYQTRDTAMALGAALARAAAGRHDVLLVASSDLSHYEDAATAAALDGAVAGHVEAFDPDGLMAALEREPRHACGGGPMVAVLHAARLLGATRARVLHYGDSGDVSGDKSSVVGYLAGVIW